MAVTDMSRTHNGTNSSITVIDTNNNHKSRMDNNKQDGHMCEKEFLRRLAVARAQLRAGAPVDKCRNDQQVVQQEPCHVAAVPGVAVVACEDDEIQNTAKNTNDNSNDKNDKWRKQFKLN